MSKKTLVDLPRFKIWVTGYYTNKVGKRVFGFVRSDARKKQKINIKNLDTNEAYQLDSLTKKKLKTLKKNPNKAIKHKTYQGVKIEQVKRKINQIKIPYSKPFSIKYDKGEYQRIESIQVYETLEVVQDSFFSAFKIAKELGAKIIVPSFRLQVIFKNRLKYRYDADYFIFAMRFDAEIGITEIDKQWQKIIKLLLLKIKEIKKNYSPKQIKFIVKFHWLI